MQACPRVVSFLCFHVLISAIALGFAFPSPATEIRVITDPHSGEWIEALPSEPGVNATNPPVQVPLAVVEETLSISVDGSVVTIVGEVRNEGDRMAGFLRLQTAGLDASGELLDSGWATLHGFDSGGDRASVQQNLIAPGEVAWFSTTLYAPEGTELTTVLLRPSGIESDEVIADLPLEMVGEWQVEEWAFGSRLTGTVRNTGTVALVGLNVTVGLRRSSDVMMAVRQDWPRASVVGGYLGGLRAGEEAEVSLSVYAAASDIAAATIETRIGAQPYTGGSFSYGVVGVAHGSGVGGSVWRSSLTLANRSGAAGNVALTLRYRTNQVDTAIGIADGESLHWDDVVRTLFNVAGSATGYLQITSTVPLAVSARTSNESLDGGYGQALPVFTPGTTSQLSNEPPGLLAPLRGGPRFRTNLGLVNMSDQTCSVNVRLFEPSGALLADLGWVRVDATTWHQLNRVVPPGVDDAYATIAPGSGCAVWAYASVIEEATGDPTTVEVVPGTGISLGFFGVRAISVVPWAGQVHPNPPRP